MTLAALGLGWLVSLGVVFVLGILSAFAFHLDPEAGGGGNGGLSLEERDLMVTIERYTGERADIAALKSVAAGEGFPQQLEQTLRAVLRHPAREDREVAARRLVEGLPFRKRMACIKFLAELPAGPARDQVWGVFLEGWAREDGRSAMGFTSSLPELRERQAAISAVLRGWSRPQPAEAWNWVVEHAGSTRRAERWLEIILTNLGSKDRMTAFDLLQRIPDSDFQEEMALVVMEQILERERAPRALDWLGELPPGTQSAAAAFVAARWALTDPEAAAEYLREAYPRAEEGLGLVLREWVYQDARAAVNWTWEQFSGDGRAVMMDLLAEEWVANDGPTPLAQWLNQRGPDPSLDAAIEQLALATAEVEPATALVWAQSVSDPDERATLEIVIGRAWLQMAPSEAADSLPLLLESEEARSVLLPEVGGNQTPQE
ncbi:MAG: hypothetical protein GVY10_07955 [Verrucomicrobia bacterium]|nr:hypothetical protein [Verrucomicrobiota bacterium]